MFPTAVCLPLAEPGGGKRRRETGKGVPNRQVLRRNEALVLFWRVN